MITLVLGGTRSGKSAYAEKLVSDAAAVSGEPVTYVATGRATDEAMATRIEGHKCRRSLEWATLEVVDPTLLVPAVAALDGLVLVDSLGSWVAASEGMKVDGPGLVAALQRRANEAVVVSEEVGLSLHAPTAIGREFVDVLGELNQTVAAAAARTVLVVAGRALELQ